MTDVADITVQKQLGAIRTFLEWAADVEAVESGLRERVYAPKVVDGAEARDDHGREPLFTSKQGRLSESAAS